MTELRRLEFWHKDLFGNVHETNDDDMNDNNSNKSGISLREIMTNNTATIINEECDDEEIFTSFSPSPPQRIVEFKLHVQDSKPKKIIHSKYQNNLLDTILSARTSQNLVDRCARATDTLYFCFKDWCENCTIPVWDLYALTNNNKISRNGMYHTNYIYIESTCALIGHPIFNSLN